ncbi:Cellulose synthase operon protein C [compost metagenome]
MTLLKTLSLALLCASAGLPAHAISPPAASNGFQVLIQQAEFWSARGRPDMARQSLERALQIDPNSEAALYRMALYSLQDDEKGAEAWLQRLRGAHPDSPRIAEVEQAFASKRMDRTGLAEIRLLARRGMTAEAANRYRALFGGERPPADLALEYYQTLAGLDEHRAEARQGLERIVRDQPMNQSAQLAYAELLTYDEATRRQGIERLAALQGQSAPARAAWRQALLWLNPDQQDQRLYEAYAAAVPGDDEVREHFAKGLLAKQGDSRGQARQRGFEALRGGRNAQAISGFNQAIRDNPRDAEAWGGLGVAQLRAQDFQAAANSLRKAGELAPQARQQWAAALASAEFYGRLAVARSARDAGRLVEAEQQARQLASAEGEQGRAARLLLGDVLLRAGKPSEAEALYRRLTATRGADKAAWLGLYNALQQQRRTAEAAQLVRQQPLLAAEKLGDLDRVEAQALREQAEAASARGDAEGASGLFAEALSLAPDDPWTRLAYARHLQRNNDPQQARSLMDGLAADSHDAETLYAGALLASEQQRWDDVRSALAAIPSAQMTADMRSLQQRAALNQRIATARGAVGSGNQVLARQGLRELYDSAPADFATRGMIAEALVELGEPGWGLNLVREDLRDSGNTRPAADYLAHVSVLAKTGQAAEAETLLRRLERRSDLSAGDLASLQALRRGFAVAQADRQRSRGDLAGAYDTLMAALDSTPDDPGLMLAMGRVYNSGKMYKEAGSVYDYVLERAPDNEDAVRGGVTAALGADNPRRASQILSRSRVAMDEPTALLLAARVAQAQGDNRRAINLLDSARRKQLAKAGSAAPGGMATLADGSQVLARANPFRDSPVAAVDTPAPLMLARSADDGTAALPYYLQARPLLADSGSVRPLGDPLIEEIDRALGELKQKSSHFVRGGLNLRARDGDSGLSQVTEVSAPALLSMVPLDNARLEVSATPAYLSAGDVKGDDRNRFGSGVLYHQGALSFERKVRTQFLEDNNYSTTAMSAADRQAAAIKVRDALFAADTGNALGDEGRALVNALVNTPAPTLLAPYDPGSQDDSGIALNAAIRGESFNLDIGATPLGFEKRNVVGGAQWTPQVGQDGRVTVGVQRRAVTDSLLSYAGTKDPFTGKSWGGVTKTGGNLQYAYDNGDGGAYVGADFYRYRGDGVEDNKSFGLSGGAYLRPIREADRELQTGLHLGWMGFDKNLSGFTLGHGGYFSPESYVGIAFPVQYKATYDKRWETRIKVAPGFQSFTQDSAPYFPTDSARQTALEFLAAQGYVSSAEYDSNSKSGFAFNASAGLEYKAGAQTRIGGDIGYDSFGDYKEVTGSIYLKHNLENLP